jgi:hypothetical protein
MAIREENKKVQDNMNYKSDKDKMQEEMLMAKLNKVEQRAYDNLKRADELDMLNDEQKEQLKNLEEKRKQ